MASRELERQLKDCLSKNEYNYKEQIRKDILHATLHFKELRPDVDTFEDNSGHTKRLMCLNGTIPVNYRGSTYNIPIRMWIQLNHPYQPPICYVRPTESMCLKVRRHVDRSGLVNLPYLHEWKHPNSDLSGLLQIMCIAFGEKPPVFERRHSNPQAQPGYPIPPSHPPHVGQRPPLPRGPVYPRQPPVGYPRPPVPYPQGTRPIPPPAAPYPQGTRPVPPPAAPYPQVPRAQGMHPADRETKQEHLESPFVERGQLLSTVAPESDVLKAQLDDMPTEMRYLGSASQAAEQTCKTQPKQWKEQVSRLTREADDFQQQMADETRENLRSGLAQQMDLGQPQKSMKQLQDDNERLQHDKENLQEEFQEQKQQLEKDKRKLLSDNQQLLEDYRLQSEQLDELQQELASSAGELEDLQCRYSTLQSAHNRCRTQPPLQSISIPASDVCLLGTRLGGGSYGVVFKAVWRGIQVAVKIFHEDLRVSEHNKKLFRQELNNCADLRHPNIVTFCGATLENDNPLQIVTELLEGSLDELIKAAISCGSYLTHSEQVHLAEGTTAGIAFLHRRQPTPYVHCDIRPANILVTRDMSAKVADLGGSHIIGASTSAGPLSANYTAPERIGDRGPRAQSCPSSDVYSLGVTLTELYTGEAAMRTARDQQLTMIGNTKLQTMCIKATSHRADKRPTAAELLVTLQQLKENEEYKSCRVRRLVMGKVEGDAVRIVAI